MKNYIGRRIKAFRAIQDITQVELAKKIGVSEKTVVFYEKGHSKVNLEFIVKICRLYGVQPSEFGIDDVHVGREN